MAGKPVARERREAAAAEQRGKNRVKRFTVAERQRALLRAEDVGSAKAAGEIGVSPATVRSWRKRLASEPAQIVTPEPQGAVEGMSAGPQERAEGRALASAAAMGEAVQELRAAIRRGDAVGARNYAVAAGIMSDKAEKLERLILDVREREPKVEAAQIDLMVKRLRGCLGELGHNPDRDSRVLVAIKRWFDGEMPTSVTVPRSRALPESAPEPVLDGEPVLDADDVDVEGNVVDAERPDEDVAGVPTDDGETATAEQAAREAAAQAPRRVPNYTPLPRGWETGGGAPGGRGRGRGPAGRAGA